MQTNRFIVFVPIITEYGRHIGNQSDHSRDHQSNYQYISSPVTDAVEVVETDKDSALLVSTIFTVISMIQITIIASNEFESKMNSNIRYICFSPSCNTVILFRFTTFIVWIPTSFQS